ncbi:MAG: hypothetical protein PWQ12_1200 [Clostridiales bacterium]|nr:hypothetical protein [Clostridiales bacterium]
MSILNDSIEKKSIRKTILTYIGWTLFCGLFSFVYEHFSHGVYSNYMIWLFLIPLIGGVVPFAAIGAVQKFRVPERIAYNLYNSGIATLAVGSAFNGVLEIYGTTSDYMPVYWVVGGVMTALGIIFYLISGREGGRS